MPCEHGARITEPARRQLEYSASFLRESPQRTFLEPVGLVARVHHVVRRQAEFGGGGRMLDDFGKFALRERWILRIEIDRVSLGVVPVVSSLCRRPRCARDSSCRFP